MVWISSEPDIVPGASGRRAEDVAVDAVGELERGRACYASSEWLDAYRSLELADRAAPLPPADLELLATSAYLLGRYDDGVRALDRAHRGHLDADDSISAARCALWLGFGLLDVGEVARATGWFGRARRLLDQAEQDCPERGYALVPVVLAQLDGEYETGFATAGGVGEIGERFDDPDLIAFARYAQGRALLRQGLIEQGLALLDEAMVAVVAGELASPLFTGLVYCSVIDACQEVYAVGRAREWTEALTRWCAAQPDMVNFTGECLVHRAEIMQLHGSWREALAEARRAAERFIGVGQQAAAAAAFYRQGEVHRLLGEFAAAEKAYRSASRFGWQPQPGLSLLRLAQGRTDAATAAIRRLLGETTDRVERARLLPAAVEIMLAAGDAARAREAADELAAIAEAHPPGLLAAMAAHARGAVELAEGDPRAALVALRQAGQVWQDQGAPYEGARARLLIGLACRALGDDDGAVLELAAARDVFEALGAAGDLARLEAMTSRVPETHRLTSRELQVLRHVAAGKSNRAIAAELVLSERTVDRHVSSIFTKIGVSSRAAATGYAYRHRLV